MVRHILSPSCRVSLWEFIILSGRPTTHAVRKRCGWFGVDDSTFRCT